MGRAVRLAALAVIGSLAQSQNASRLAFEVASVRPSTSGAGRSMLKNGRRLRANLFERHLPLR